MRRRQNAAAANAEEEEEGEEPEEENFNTSQALPSWREVKAQVEAPAERVCGC